MGVELTGSADEDEVDAAVGLDAGSANGCGLDSAGAAGTARAESANTGESGESAKSAESAESAESVESVESVEDAESVQDVPDVPVESVEEEPVEPIGPSAAWEQVEKSARWEPGPADAAGTASAVELRPRSALATFAPPEGPAGAGEPVLGGDELPGFGGAGAA